MDIVIDKLLSHLNSPVNGKALIDQKEVLIEKARFSSISPHPLVKLWFVDGGSQELLASPSFSVYYCKVYGVQYLGRIKQQSRLISFYVFARAVVKDKLYYSGEYIGNVTRKEFLFDPSDRRISLGGKIAPISLVGNMLRRFMELEFTRLLNGNIIIDGTLEATYPYEDEIISSLREEVCSISKTNTLLTADGRALLPHLESLSPGGSWSYPLAEVGKRKIWVAKLNKRSEHLVRFESQKKDIPGLLYSLAENSKDLVFPGYPYGLIEADRFARVSNSERDGLILRLKSMLGKDFDKIKADLNAVNAHSILDNIG